MSSLVPAKLRQTLTENGQNHVLHFIDENITTKEAGNDLIKELEKIDCPRLGQIFVATMKANSELKSESGHLQCISDVLVANESKGKELEEIGLKAIGNNQIAAILLAGGQGTRLGFSHPKGEYDLELPSHKSLFELQANRLTKLCELAAVAVGKKATDVVIPWYIMTSPMTDKETREYFVKHHYFGLNQANVMFFEQGTLPCLTPEGKIILENDHTISCGPDGNGGIYMAMHSQGVVADMLKRKITYVHTFGVDNAVVKVADPIFLGYCIQEKAEVGCKSCPKACPEEAVGVLCKKDGKYEIVEYCELDPAVASKTNPDGSLYLNTGFICNLAYSVEFLNTTCHPDNLPRVYHLANKKIPYADLKTGKTLKPDKPNGIKLESFIFDVFPAIKKLATYQVDRLEEFSPVKNPPGNPIDSPDSARQIFTNNHKNWLHKAGAKILGEGLCEVTPYVSYAGEGLDNLKGLSLQSPCLIQKKEETLKTVKSIGETLNTHVSHILHEGINIYSC